MTIFHLAASSFQFKGQTTLHLFMMMNKQNHKTFRKCISLIGRNPVYSAYLEIESLTAHSYSVLRETP